MTARQADIVGGPAELAVRAYLREHVGEWVTAKQVAKAAGLTRPVAAELLLILALQDEVERAGDTEASHTWRLPALDPDWLTAIALTTPEQRAYWGDRCDVCPARPGYAVDIALCREHILSGTCFTCGSPMSSFGRAPGDYVCQGRAEGNPESLWRHQHGPYAHYEGEVTR
jgi:hypothetical protein